MVSCAPEKTFYQLCSAGPRMLVGLSLRWQIWGVEYNPVIPSIYLIEEVAEEEGNLPGDPYIIRTFFGFS